MSKKIFYMLLPVLIAAGLLGAIVMPLKSLAQSGDGHFIPAPRTNGCDEPDGVVAPRGTGPFSVSAAIPGQGVGFHINYVLRQTVLTYTACNDQNEIIASKGVTVTIDPRWGRDYVFPLPKNAVRWVVDAYLAEWGGSGLRATFAGPKQFVWAWGGWIYAPFAKAQ